MNRNKPNINANEIKQWDFCPRQWYLIRTKGRTWNDQPARRGQEFHQQHAVPVKQIQKTQSFISKIVTIGGAACLFWLLSLLEW